jgi:hypothetical protein
MVTADPRFRPCAGPTGPDALITTGPSTGPQKGDVAREHKPGLDRLRRPGPFRDAHGVRRPRRDARGVVVRAGAPVLFGATGDLARKKLFPALYHLAAAKRLGVPVVGVASSDWDDARLRRYAIEAVEAAEGRVDGPVLDELGGGLAMVSGDYRDPGTFAALGRRQFRARDSQLWCNQEEPPGVVYGREEPWVLTIGCSWRQPCRTWTWSIR